MRLSVAALTLSFASFVSAHGYIKEFIINGQSYPGWRAYGPASQPGTINRPVPETGPPTPFSSGTAIICNDPQNRPATAIANATAGSVVTTVWDWNSNHPGPILGYLAKCNGPCSNFRDDGPWVKFQQDGYDPSKSPGWAEERLRSNGGRWDFRLPRNLADGEYLLRTELLGLHVAGNVGGAQFYPSCAHLRITGGSGGNWPQGIRISGAYRENDPGVRVDLWRISPQNPQYTIPGGPVLLPN